eukprot:CAMPEP_0118644788 /NCGR_PEP_ID=MMETSP0785-20121206/7137_1 /TAXON_ID=91992 /ORGANISM="Bolidomonas pacifica, Strain CCMP 1866" /LENGTH=985 /DNA_ID=CAMNT_0006536593 /DNA_START=120 /DNA_END=3073 /DNA_ORIENTATION=-
MAFHLQGVYESSATSIYQECSDLTAAMLGNGRRLLLYFCIVLSILMRLSCSAVVSSLIMMLYGSYVTTTSPASIASGVLFYSIFLAAGSTIRSVITKKCGRHFFENCKHCIMIAQKSLSPDEEVNLMNDITVVQELLIDRWVSQTALAITEIAAIFCILFFDASLFGYACLLYAVSKSLSLCEDWMHLKEQEHYNKINFLSSSSSAGTEEEEVSWHRNALAGHSFITMIYAAYSHFMPAIFLYIALTACTETPEDEGLLLSKAMSSCIFFFVACFSALKQHGNTEYMIKNCFHGYKVIKFDKDNDSSVFTKEAIASYKKEAPNVTCSAGIKNMTIAEMAGYSFILLSFAGLVITVVFVLTAGFELREPSSSDDGGASTLGRRMTEVEIFEAKTGGSLCSDTVITCSHFPDDGSYSTFLTGSHFSLTEGCTLDASAGDSDLLRHCADIFVALENEDDEAIEITYEDEETDDIAAAYEATMEIGTEAVAEDTPSNTDVGGSKVIAASYTNWKNSKHTFQQVFSVDGIAESDITEAGRRLNSGSASMSGSSTPYSTAPIDEYADFVPVHYDCTFTVGTGRYDGSKDHISVKLIGSEGSSDLIHLGNKFKKGEERTAKIYTPKSLGTITSVELVSSGKDGLKFKKIEIDGTHEGGMKGYVKCRGSKRKGTWSCLGVVPIMPISGGGCIAECDPTQQPDVPSLSGVVTFDSSSSDFDELTYPFGKVWNSCSVKGPMKFTYDAKCDTGCEARAHSFKIPDAVVAGFDADSKAEKGKDGGCQQDSTAAYPEWCLQPLKDGAPWSMEGLSSSERKAQCNEKVAHDRGHQIPANNFDHDKDIITATNYMTNIMPQAAQMNRGAWLKTEMLVECWRNYLPTLVFGGAVLLGDGGTTLADIPEWGGYDRSDWFVASHGVKNPAYFWKVLVTGADPSKGEDIEQHIAFWIPNHESASNSNTKDYIVSIDELEANLAKFGETISFNMAGKGEKWADVW